MNDPFMRRIDTDIVREQSNHYASIALRVIDMAGAGLMSLLAVRFVFMLLGANATNGLASFVYGFTTPFVTPFAGLFNYDNFVYGVSHFEGFTLVAIGFYALLTAGLRRLATVTWW
jgi:hypothetical protein